MVLCVCVECLLYRVVCLRSEHAFADQQVFHLIRYVLVAIIRECGRKLLLCMYVCLAITCSKRRLTG